jgi:hypothetical protein
MYQDQLLIHLTLPAVVFDDVSGICGNEWRLTNDKSTVPGAHTYRYKRLFCLWRLEHLVPLTPHIIPPKMKQPTGTEKPETPLAHFETKGAEGYPTFLPAQPQAIGSLLPSEKFPQNAKPAKLFEPLTIRGVTFPNRCWVAPMCMCKSSLELDVGR